MSPDDGSAQTPADTQSWNLYTYVRGNPVNMNDPTGHTYGMAQQTLDYMNKSPNGELLRQAWKTWSQTKGGAEQLQKMKKDSSGSTFTLVAGHTPSGGSNPNVMGEALPGKWNEAKPEGKKIEPVTPTVNEKGNVEQEGVLMYIDVDHLVASGQNTVEEIVGTIAEEAEHALTSASGEYTPTEASARNLAVTGSVDRRKTPRQESIFKELKDKKDPAKQEVQGAGAP